MSIFLFRFEIHGNAISFVVNQEIAMDMYEDIDEKLKPLAHACCETLSRYRHLSVSTRVSKNAVFGLNFLPGFWTWQILWIVPILTGFGPHPRGPKSGQGQLADLARIFHKKGQTSSKSLIE